MPATPLAVNAGAKAVPLLPVVTLAVVDPPVKVPLAPLPGAVNFTLTPLTGLPPLSVTVACSSAPNAVPTVALCESPADATMFAAGPAVFVKLKLAVPATPLAVAVTA